MIEITIQLWKCSFSGKISMYSTNKSLGLLVYIFLTNNVTSLIINQLQWLSISLFASILLWKRTTNISLEPMKYFWPRQHVSKILSYFCLQITKTYEWFVIFIVRLEKLLVKICNFHTPPFLTFPVPIPDE